MVPAILTSIQQELFDSTEFKVLGHSRKYSSENQAKNLDITNVFTIGNILRYDLLSTKWSERMSLKWVIKWFTKIVIPSAHISLSIVGFEDLSNAIELGSSSWAESSSGAHHRNVPIISRDVYFEEGIKRREIPKSERSGWPVGETRTFACMENLFSGTQWRQDLLQTQAFQIRMDNIARMKVFQAPDNPLHLLESRLGEI